jgi:FMN phosphatase YigB (HAD superfamily)
MRRPQIKHIVSDNDGTLNPFPTWYAHALLSAIPFLATTLGVSPAEVIVALQSNFTAARTHMCAFPFVGAFFASAWKGTKEEFVEKVTKPYFELIDGTRDQYLEPYPGVKETLQTTRRLGIGVTVLSDGPLYATLAALTHSQLQDGIDGVYAMRVHKPDAADVWNGLDYAFCNQRLQRYLALGNQFAGAPIVPLDIADEKPNTGGCRLIVDNRKLDADRTIIMGDSRAKDGGVALAMGMRFVWARYGSHDYVPLQYRKVQRSVFNPEGLMPPGFIAEPPVDLVVATYDGVIPLLQRYRRKAS